MDIGYWVIMGIFTVIGMVVSGRLKSKFAHERDVNNTLISQQELYKERDRITADLHDEIGGGLSTIRILSDIHKNVNDVETHKKFAEKIAEVSEDLSQKMRTIIWTLKPVNEYAKSIFDNTSIVFSFTENIICNKSLHLKNTTRKNLFLCIKEALTNILKHADATNVSINITVSNSNQLTIVITDNGKGITNTSLLGNGMRIMEKRMKEIGGSFSFNTNENKTQLQFSVFI